MELRVVQFWREIMLLWFQIEPISFEITRMISDQIGFQIALHSVQLPLIIIYQWSSEFAMQ